MSSASACTVLQAGGEARVGQEVAQEIQGHFLAAVYDWPSLQGICRLSAPDVVVMDASFVQHEEGKSTVRIQQLGQQLAQDCGDGDAHRSHACIALWSDEPLQGLSKYASLEEVIGCYVLPHEWQRLRAELHSWWQHRARGAHLHAETPAHSSRYPQENGSPITAVGESPARPFQHPLPEMANSPRRSRAGEQIAAPSLRHQALGGPQVMPRQLIAVVGPKGGVGKTFVAVNLAAGLAQHSPFRTLLIDLDLTSSDTAVHLDLLDASGLIDLLPHSNELRRRGLEPFVTREPHAGLDVLAGPDEPQLAELVTDVHIDAVLRQAVSDYPFVIADTGPDVRASHVRLLLQEASTAVLVTAPEATSLRHTRQLLDHLKDDGTPPRLMTVVNGLHAGSPVNVRGIQGFLDHQVTAVIERSAAEVEASIFNGRPLVLHHPDAPPVAGLQQLLRAVYPSSYEGDRSLTGRVRRWGQRLVTQWLGAKADGASGGVPLGL